MGKDKSRKESVAKSSERSSGSKHRSRSEERRKHKHSKRKHKKEKKSSKDDDKASRSGTDAIVVAAQAGRVTEEIASEDFFRLSEEFRVWLHMTAKRRMEEMSTDEARALFEDFVSLWNGRRLSTMYYDGIPAEIRDAYVKSKHKWGFQLSEQEKAQLVDTADEVERKTRRRTEGAWNHMAPSPVPAIMRGNLCLPVSVAAPERPSTKTAGQYEREMDREKDRAVNKFLRGRHSDYLDEVAPKETGHAAVRDKRLGAASAIHGSAAEKEMSRDGLELSEADIFGGGDDFASLKARLDKGKNFRDGKRNERLRELQEKEKTRAAHALAQIGIDFTNGGKIVIAPRNDP